MTTIYKPGRLCGGWLMIEMMVALAILGILAVGLAQTQYHLGRFNAVQLARMRCIAAAQAQLDSISATGQPIADNELARLWPGVRTVVDESPGQGDWTGLTMVKVTASGSAKGPEVKLELARYVVPK